MDPHHHIFGCHLCWTFLDTDFSQLILKLWFTGTQYSFSTDNLVSHVTKCKSIKNVRRKCLTPLCNWGKNAWPPFTQVKKISDLSGNAQFPQKVIIATSLTVWHHLNCLISKVSKSLIVQTMTCDFWLFYRLQTKFTNFVLLH